jgi:hypothetical protein
LSKRPAKSEKEKETGKMDKHAEKMRNEASKLPASSRPGWSPFYMCIGWKL